MIVSSTLVVAAGHDAARVLKFLTDNQAAQVKAQEQYDAALAEAKQSGKRVFLHFGAPWCGSTTRSPPTGSSRTSA